MLSEFGTSDRATSPAWYAAIPDVLPRYPNLRALILQLRPAQRSAPVRTLADLCDNRVTGQPAALAAFAGAGHAAYLNQPRRAWP